MHHTDSRQHRRLQTILNHLQTRTDSANSLLHTSPTSSLISLTPNTRVKFTNWAKIHSCTPKFVHHPSSLHEIQQIIRVAASQNQKVKVAGSGHSPNAIAMTDEHMIFLDKYNKVQVFDFEKQIVKVQAGIKLGTLVDELAKVNMALPSLGSIVDQTIAGLISTGTHGSGATFGIIASSIVEMEMVTAKADVIVLSNTSNPDIFKAALCGLGALGIITSISMQCEKLYALRAQQVPLSLEYTLENLNSLVHAHEHYRFWWFPHTNQCVSWGADRVSAVSPKKAVSPIQHLILLFKNRVVGFHVLQALLYVARFFPALIPILNRLYFYFLHKPKKSYVDDYKSATTFDCLFPQFVNEWTIPFERTKEAMMRLKKFIMDKEHKVHFPIEVRFNRGDDIWLSPCYDQTLNASPTQDQKSDKIYTWIGIIMYRPYGITVRYKKYFDEFSQLMLELGGRPHWAKDFKLSQQDLQRMYPKWNDFLQLRQQLDPDQMFVNSFLKDLFRLG